MEVLKLLVLQELPKIAALLEARRLGYQGANQRQIEALEKSMQQLQGATVSLVHYLREHEPSNEGELRRALEVAGEVFGQRMEPMLGTGLATGRPAEQAAGEAAGKRVE